MAWNDTPKSADIILTTQQPIQSNFANFDTAFAINHYAIDVALLKGLHKRMDLVRQDQTSGDITVGANEIAFYDNQVSTGDNLFVQKSTGAASVTQTTKSSRQLASGIIIKTGSKEFNSVTTSLQSVDITFKGGAFTSVPHTILLNAQNFTNRSLSGNYIILSYSNVTTTGFKMDVALVSGSSAWTNPTIVNYIAIGV